MIRNLETEDYASFCGLNVPVGEEAGIRRTAVKSMDSAALVVDVRPSVEFGIAKLDGSLNVPIQSLLKNPAGAWDQIHKAQRNTLSKDVLVVCKKGNDSQLAVRALLQHQKHLCEQAESEAQQAPPAPSDPLQGSINTREPKTPNQAQAITPLQISDLIGGLRAYSKEKDPSFPVY